MKKALLIIPRARRHQIDEALALAESANYKVAGIVKARDEWRINKGVLAETVKAARDNGVDAIIYYGNLQPSSAFKVMKEAGVRVIDRVELILEIFSEHAGSREARLQIEMAKIKHELPMIRELIRRSKMGEYPGFLGPGGYAIDSYYRHLTRRLAKIRRELEKIRLTIKERAEKRRHGGMIHVSIVGYASAGKTSIFNRITGESKPVGEKYFTTLHPKHKLVKLGGVKAIFIDTVGFIRDVPPEVIEAFFSTLEEVSLSDSLIFVVDVSEPERDLREKLRAGLKTLADIGASSIPMVVGLNKVDMVDPLDYERKSYMVREILYSLSRESPIIPVSARTGEGLEELSRASIAVALGVETCTQQISMAGSLC